MLDKIIQIALLSRLNPDVAVIGTSVDLLVEMEEHIRLYRGGLQAKLKEIKKSSRLKT